MYFFIAILCTFLLQNTLVLLMASNSLFVFPLTLLPFLYCWNRMKRNPFFVLPIHHLFHLLLDQLMSRWYMLCTRNKNLLLSVYTCIFLISIVITLLS